MNVHLQPSLHGLPFPIQGLDEVHVEGATAVAAGLSFILGSQRRHETRPATVMLAAPRAWLNERGWPSAASLAAFDLAPEDVLVAAPRTETEALWALEEALRSGAVSLAIGAVERASLLATRRLDWAARAAGARSVLIKAQPAGDLSAARRRWRVAPHPSAPHPWDAKASGAARWHVTLERSRDGSAGTWIMEQDPETHRLNLVDGLADHSLGPIQRRSA